MERLSPDNVASALKVAESLLELLPLPPPQAVKNNIARIRKDLGIGEKKLGMIKLHLLREKERGG